MLTMAVPYHLDERLHGFTVGVPIDHEVTADLPAGGPWERMGVLYEQVAREVARTSRPLVVVSGDCTTSLGVLAGLQRAGQSPGIVWFDAHADFHTEQTTTSHYLGGMPLAKAVGRGTPAVSAALGAQPVPEARVLLADARDTDPGEHGLLRRSGVHRARVDDVPAMLPNGALYLHIDLDVCDPHDVPGLLYPAPNGPSVAAVIDAVQVVIASGRVVAVGIAATWDHRAAITNAQRSLMNRLHHAVS